MTDNNKPQEEKHKSKADKAYDQKARVFFDYNDGILPDVLPAALENGRVSIHSPQAFGRLSDFVPLDSPMANEPSFHLRLQLSAVEIPTRMKLKDLYQAAAAALAQAMEDGYMGGKFKDARVLLDAAVPPMEIELDDEHAQIVGAKNVTISLTITLDVTDIVPSALEVEVEDDK